ncbi:right-handed parallel beta-helix repeat-containing protein [bacterium]|nr:right-handed parallel beta-helix repeat-containing protein [candidate division CSSED10-310 bacterium]
MGVKKTGGRSILMRIFAIGIFAVAPPVLGETFYPDTEAELQEAFHEAEHNTEDDIIYIQPHHYGLTGVLQYQPAAGGYARRSLSVIGVSGTSGPPRLDGNSLHGVLDINTYYSADDWGAEIVIENLVIQNAGDVNYGAGLQLYCQEAAISVSDCYFTNNQCNFCGGGIHAITLSNITVVNCVFQENSATGHGGDSRGGGLYVRQYGDLGNFINNTFIDNEADGSPDQAYFSIINCTSNVYNNVFWPGDIGGYLYNDSALNLYHNVYETALFDGIGTFSEGDNFMMNPDLDASFSPHAESICIDNGGSYHGVPPEDFYGNARPNPNTGIVDIGAVEYYGSGPPPTATPPSGEIGIELTLPAWVRPFQDFWVAGIIYNGGPAVAGIPVVVVLDVLSSYWFWPCWEPPGSGSPPFCYGVMDIPTGNTNMDVLPLFEWPDTGSQTMSGLYFYGALMVPDFSAILGTWDAREFGFGP